MTSLLGTEVYFQKFIELQDKLRKSEEERLKLEIKFNEMVQTTREEDQLHYRKIQGQYKRFLEEDRKRQERNENILRALERVENRSGMLAAKTERLKFLRKQYQNYMNRVRVNFNAADSKTRTEKQQLPLEHVRLDANKKDILDKYFQNLAAPKCKAEISENTQRYPFTLVSDDQNVETNHLMHGDGLFHREDVSSAISVADEIMTTIESQRKYSHKFTNDNLNFADRYKNGPVDTNLQDVLGYRDVMHPVENFRNNIQTPITDKTTNVDKNDRIINDSKDVKERDIHSERNSAETVLNTGLEINKLLDDYNDKTDDIIRSKHEQIQLNQTLQFDNIKESTDQQLNIINHDTDECALPTNENRTVTIDNNIIDQHDKNEQPIGPFDKNRQINQQNNEYEQPVQPYDANGQSIIKQNDNHCSEQPVEQFNKNRQITEQNYEYGHQPIQQYDENKQLTQQLDEHAQQYHEDDQLIQQYDHDQHGQPIQQYDDNEQSIQQYDENGQDIQQYDEHGQAIQQYNDENEQFIQQYDENGQPIQQYDEHGQPIQQYDDENGQFVQQYDENGQPIQQYDEHGQPIQQYGDENGQFIQQYDEHGQPIQQYDENGQLIPQYDENGQLIPPNDKHGQPIQQYDENGQLIQQYDKHHGQPIQQYDEHGQPIQQYDENGQVIQQYEGYDQQYDEYGQPFHYDEHGKQQYFDENGQLVHHSNQNQQLAQQYDTSEKLEQPYDEQYNEPFLQPEKVDQIVRDDDSLMTLPQHQGKTLQRDSINNESKDSLQNYVSESVSNLFTAEEVHNKQELITTNSEIKACDNEVPSQSSADFQKANGSDENTTSDQSVVETHKAEDDVKLDEDELKMQATTGNVIKMLDTDTESLQQDTTVSNDTDFDFSK